MKEGKSESDSEQEADCKEEYETMAMSEAACDEQRYDEEMDLIEEGRELQKILSKDFSCFHFKFQKVGF